MPRAPTPTKASNVFVNVPYGREYETRFVAFVAGLVGLGCSPRCAVEVMDGGEGRLGKIYRLLKASEYSVHDLSCVKLSGPSRVPRFNMPFELGLAYVLRQAGRHQFVVFEEKRYRLQESLSDLNGHDPVIHGGTAVGVLRGLHSCFSSGGDSVTLRGLNALYEACLAAARRAKRLEQVELFSPAGYRMLVEQATRLAQEQGVLR